MTKANWVVFCLAFFSASVAAQQYHISTIAGGSAPATPAPALRVFIGYAQGVAADASGNVYFASSDLHAVFKIDVAGVLTRVAGNLKQGYSGDGGPGANAQLNGPNNLVVDAAGNLYIADSGNNRVRRVDANGVITTVAGNGAFGSSGDGGPAVSAQLYPIPDSGAISLAVDKAGNLFLAENCRVRKATPNGIISTIAGTGTCGSSGDGGPAINATVRAVYSIAADAAGNLFLACEADGIRKVSADGTISTLTTARSVGNLAVDGAGNLYIAEAQAQRVRKVSSDGTFTIVAGNGMAGLLGDGGPATQAQVYNPWSVAFDSAGSMFIAGPVAIRKVTSAGVISTVAGNGWSYMSGDGGAAINAQINGTNAVVLDNAGNIFFADAGNGFIRRVSPSGIITSVAGGGIDDSDGPANNVALRGIQGLAVDGPGNLFIADGNRVRKVTADGMLHTIAGNANPGFSGDGGLAITASLNSPSGLAVDGANNLFIADSFNRRVRKISPAGIITTVAGNGSLTQLPGAPGDGGPAMQAPLDYPAGLATDGGGNLFVADAQDHRVRKIDSNGTITTVAGISNNAGFAGDGGLGVNAELSWPSGVAVDAAGNVFIADTNNYRVRRVSPSGVIATVAGGVNPYAGCFAGDGGPAVGAAVGEALALTVDAGGNIYVAEGGDFENLVFDVAVQCSSIRLLHPSNSSAMVTAVTDAASARTNAISPGKIVVIYGTGLGPSQVLQNQPVNGIYSSDFAGTKVFFNSIAAPILYTSSTQVAAVAPYALSGSTAQVTVSYQGQMSDAFGSVVAAAAPTLFTANETGAGQAAAVNADGKVNSAVMAAKIGEYISLYATGEGQTAPAGVDGKLGGSTPARPVLPVTVMIGGIPAAVQYAGGAPGQVAGLMQINVQIPSGVQPGGYVPVVLHVGDASSTPGAVWIAVSN